MCGHGGKIRNNFVTMDWNEFTRWQRWDEFPELSENPPLTVDVSFMYNGRHYYLDIVNRKYSILSKDWHVIISDENLLRLLTKSVDQWDDASFKELMDSIEFEI